MIYILITFFIYLIASLTVIYKQHKLLKEFEGKLQSLEYEKFIFQVERDLENAFKLHYNKDDTDKGGLH